MTSEREFLDFAAETLGVDAAALSFETEYGTLAEWDSMAHLRLVMAVRDRFGYELPFAEVTQVTSLWELYRRLNRLSPKKAVAVDFDGVLWDGVLGEDGLDALVPRSAFQRELRALKDRGVLLVGLTKNNPEDVERYFAAAENPNGLKNGAGGVLRRDDFVSVLADWEPKAGNLLKAARELNLGLDAFVFVDDSPVERAEMAAKLPEVTVAQFPPRLSAYFPEGALTEEDRCKTEQYREEAARRRFAEGKSEADWLAGLEMEIDVHPIRPEEFARVAQLSQKANQFVTVVHRYSADEISAFAADSSRIFLTAHCRDRFGDLGLIGYVHTLGAEVVDFTLSCRAAGRGIDRRLADALKAAGLSRGITAFQAPYVPTGRNRPAVKMAAMF